MKAKEITIFVAGEKQTFLFPAENDIQEFMNGIILYCYNTYKGTDAECLLNSLVYGYDSSLCSTRLERPCYSIKIFDSGCRKTYYLQIGDEKIFEIVEKY